MSLACLAFSKTAPMTFQTNWFFFFRYSPSYQNMCIMHISNPGHNSPLEILDPRCLDDHPGVGICNCVDWNIQWIFRVLAWNDEWHSRIRWQGPLRHVKINLAWVMQAGLRIRLIVHLCHVKLENLQLRSNRRRQTLHTPRFTISKIPTWKIHIQTEIILSLWFGKPSEVWR